MIDEVLGIIAGHGHEVRTINFCLLWILSLSIKIMFDQTFLGQYLDDKNQTPDVDDYHKHKTSNLQLTLMNLQKASSNK